MVLKNVKKRMFWEVSVFLYNASQNILQKVLQNIFCVPQKKEKMTWVWNDMRVSKWWENFGVNKDFSEIWSHSDLVHVATPVHPSSVFVLYRGGKGKRTSLPSNLTQIFSLLCTFPIAPLSLSFFGRPYWPLHPLPQLSRLCLYSTLLPNKRHGTISPKPNARTWTCGESKQRLVFSFL